VLIPQQQRAALVGAVAGRDPIDVLAAIAALQLLPQNANALFRLEAAAARMCVLSRLCREPLRQVTRADEGAGVARSFS
jgi:hypothetical protein